MSVMTGFPLGGAVTIAELTEDPHPVLRRLRAAEPVSWLPALGGWVVSRRDLAEQVLRDARGFTVDDPRFTTARVVGPSMLSLDGAEHRRHRDPFARALRRGDVSAGLAAFAADEAARLVTGLAPAGRAELRRGLAGPLAVAVMAEVLGLADIAPAMLLSWYDAIVAGVSALEADPGGLVDGGPGLAASEASRLASEPGASAVGPRMAGTKAAWAGMAAAATDSGAASEAAGAGAVVSGSGVASYASAAGAGAVGSGPGVARGAAAAGPGMVAATAAPGVAAAAAAAFGELRAGIEAAIGAPGAASLLAHAAGTAGLSIGEVVSNAAVMLFGGIETTEGMICNLILHLLSGAGGMGEVLAERALIGNAIDESLRLEPAAAVVDRYATAEVRLGQAEIRGGDLVVVSLAGANRDPEVFPDPDSFDIRRSNARQNLGFALGPHFCVGAQLARLEAAAAVTALLDRLPGLRLDPGQPSKPLGLVFRKPPALHVIWD
jgi:cytochrome P450